MRQWKPTLASDGQIADRANEVDRYERGPGWLAATDLRARSVGKVNPGGRRQGDLDSGAHRNADLLSRAEFRPGQASLTCGLHLAMVRVRGL